MKIKDYKCKCGSDDFFFAENGNSIGIYCSYCGKWKKWADKDERNLSMKREQETGKWIVEGQEVYCSKCKKISGYNWNGASAFSKFCPNCGADMRGGDAK